MTTEYKTGMTNFGRLLFIMKLCSMFDSVFKVSFATDKDYHKNLRSTI